MLLISIILLYVHLNKIYYLKSDIKYRINIYYLLCAFKLIYIYIYIYIYINDNFA